MEQKIRSILSGTEGLKAVRRNALIHIFTLFVALPSRVNFLAMARHGHFSERTYRNHFEKKFDFFDFNKQLVKQFCSPHRIIAGDCSFIPKAGKSTPHLGKFWSGCASKALPGLEISSLAVIDVDTNRAFHLECEQTPGTLPDNESRIDFYVDQVVRHAKDLKELADYFVYDGAAAKKKFADGIVEHTGLHLVSKLRRDANLRYLYTGPRRPGPGKPKQYDGKIQWKNLELNRFDICYEDDEIIIHTAIVNSVSLKRNIRIAYISRKGSDSYAVLFSTDINLDGLLIYKYYKARFQIEFLFRDAKQYTGLTHCQARSENKLYFHFNCSLTSVSLAKADFFDKVENQGAPFSMRNITDYYSTKLFLDRILSKLDIELSSEKFSFDYEELLNTAGALA
ncbi:MAG: transposase [Candidatus Electrothrix sp. Rat3]|nr:transposase [Candidatus Electrothrix rattekaaiensis]MDU9047543.1 transposase [Candidatus Electrothrix rattekaaiensis]MDU9048480.1 transposase [Candidatus Electrothrix rattekaaiensis]MDU9048561.1 transposase [Candidatus Electrothrix rattekaaiensis]MDU9049436.1 transposase [Candidatus Electrothrix rattekaaiensis]